jgi:hypothetical protein
VKYLTGAFRIAVVLAIAWFVGLAVAVASAMVGHRILAQPYGDDRAAYLAGIVSGIVALVVGWRHLVAGPSPGISRRLAYALGWSLVGWVAAGVAGTVLYGSANALAYLIAVGFGVVAYVVLLFRDRGRAVAQHRLTMTERVTSPDAD